MIEVLTEVELDTFTTFILGWGALSIVSALVIHFGKLMPISGREKVAALSAMGDINKRAGWIIMETPILLVVGYFFAVGKNPLNPAAIMAGAFIFHYIHRALIFPYRIKTEGKTMPISTMLASMVFYIINGYIIGHYFGSLKTYPPEWVYDPRFIIGMALFIAGFIINVTSDNILINLRKPGETGYKIPYGGFYRFVSCPNYFGEIVEWIGFAIMAWCLPATIYAAWVVLPLFTQGINAHQWYLDKFKDEYPKERKAVIPYLV